MREKCLYILFVFVVMIFSVTKFDALTCKYEDPFNKGKEIVIDFDTLNSAGYQASPAYAVTASTCINSANSSFKNVVLWNISGANIFLNSATDINGKNYVFDSNVFEHSFCINTLLNYAYGENINRLKCPILGYYPENGKINNRDVEFYVLTGKSTCGSKSDCKILTLLEDVEQVVDKDGNVTEVKKVKTCAPQLNLTDGNTTVPFEIYEYNDGSFSVSIDGTMESYKNGDYAIDVQIVKSKKNFVIKQEHWKKFLNLNNPDEGTGMSCLKNVYGYWDENINNTGAYVLVTSKDDIPKNGNNTDQKIGSCVDYLGHASEDGTVAKLLDKVYTIIKIVSILIVILWSLLDLSKVIIYSKDELMATVRKISIRLALLVIILLLPTLIDLIGRAFGFDDVLCGIK